MSEMLSDIQYEPLLIMISGYDSEWSRQSYTDGSSWHCPVLGPFDTFSRGCREFTDRLQANYQKLCDANGIKAEGGFLGCYEPLCYIPLGHADILAITLLDDFDAIHHLAGGMRTTLENLHVGFIPSLGSLGVGPEENLFCSLPELFEQKCAPKNKELPPLLVFSKLKMHGLATVGLGLCFQAALWRAIVARIREVVSAMRDRFCEASKRESICSIEVSDWPCPGLVDLECVMV